jgi:dolichol-phosphate mannosyltransferase
MEKTPKIIVVLPAYNEVGKIGNTVRKVLNDPPQGIVTTCLVVDDGSTDDSVKEAESNGAVVLRQQKNQGVGSAIRAGIRYAIANGFEIVIVMAGDDQDIPAEIPVVIEPIVKSDFDFVQGSRRIGGRRTVNMPLFRRITTRIYSIAFRLCTGFPCTDGTNGFRAFKTSLFTNPAINLDQAWLNTYELEPYLFYQSVKLGYRVCEVPVTKYYHKEMLSYSKMVPFKDWWNILKPLFYLRLGLRK